MSRHLIFYDVDCDCCYRIILLMIDLDPRKKFLFAPQDGDTARAVLTGPNIRYMHENSLILFEDFRSDKRELYTSSQALLRCYWLLEKRWIGWLSFLPHKICDMLYPSASNHRHRLRFGWQRTEFQGDRFLP